MTDSTKLMASLAFAGAGCYAGYHFSKDVKGKHPKVVRVLSVLGGWAVANQISTPFLFAKATGPSVMSDGRSLLIRAELDSILRLANTRVRKSPKDPTMTPADEAFAWQVLSAPIRSIEEIEWLRRFGNGESAIPKPTTQTLQPWGTQYPASKSTPATPTTTQQTPTAQSAMSHTAMPIIVIGGAVAAFYLFAHKKKSR